jgi:hypothetical protein
VDGTWKSLFFVRLFYRCEAFVAIVVAKFCNKV